METLRKLFPYSFKEKKDIAALVINIIVYVVIGFIAGILMSVFALIPFIGILISIIGAAIDLYVVIAIVISILDYLKILK